MQMFEVTVEVAPRQGLDPETVKKRLRGLRPRVTATGPGTQAVTLTIPADTPQLSAAAGLRIVQNACDARPLACSAVSDSS